MNAAKLLLVCVASLGCGGGTKPASQTKPMTQAQPKLGHFTTPDGMHGFVLDRTAAKAKLQIDGSADIIELTMEEDREFGALRGYTFVGPDNTKRIHLTTGGSLVYFKDGDQFSAFRDRDVKPLGKPTVAGAPVKEPDISDTRGAALAAITVRKRFPAFTSNDSANLVKVAEAFDKADTSMIVRYKDPGKDGWRANLQVAPSNIAGVTYSPNAFGTDEDQMKRHIKLAKHGATLRGFSSPETPRGNHIIVSARDDTNLKLKDGMPGLMWEVDSTQAVFVAIDGGRYIVDISQENHPIAKGAGPEAGWPKPATDTFADMSMISAIAKAGGGGDKVIGELEKIDDAWNACVVKGWKTAAAKLEKVEPLRLTVAEVKSQIKTVHNGCVKHLEAFESVIVKWIDERAKSRLALHAKAAAKARLAP